VTNIEHKQEPASAAPRAAIVPPVGAPRGGNFWQRWKEWERESGSIPAPMRNRAA
jgi:hypothetical protein